MSTRFAGLLLAAAALTALGCEDKNTKQPPLASPKPGPGMPPPVAPPASPHGAPAADASGPVVTAMGASVTLPAAWKREAPSSAMRLAQALVPGAGGDAAKAASVVFSTAGGTVADNIERWAGQVRDPKGQPVPGKPETRTIGGLKVTSVEMTGAFAGMGDSAPKDNWTLKGAIIEAPEGLLFIKMTGPADTVAAAGKDFEALLQSAKKP